MIETKICNVFRSIVESRVVGCLFIRFCPNKNELDVTKIVQQIGEKNIPHSHLS